MCICAAPALWPLILLGLLVAALAALAATGVLNLIASAFVAFIVGAVAIRVAGAVIGNALERRRDRRWNAKVAAAMAARHQIPARRHVDITVVEDEPPAIEAARPALPAAVRIHPTPVQELTRGVQR